MPDPAAAAIHNVGARVRVYTLGRFAVEVDGAPLVHAGRGPRRPLALLKGLVAEGGQAVAADQLTDSIWPDSDGDQAQRAFRIALHRLRGLIGREAVRLSGARLTLSPALCWVDAHEFLALVEAARAATGQNDASTAWARAERTLALYQGPFLAGEFEPAEIQTARERLHGAFLRNLGALGKFFAARGDVAQAIELYRQGLERDELAEELAQGLMCCYRDQGRTVEALGVCRRLREALEDRMGIAVSPQTEALERELRQRAPVARASDETQGGLGPTQQPAMPTTAAPAVEALKREALLPLPDIPSIVVLPFANLGGDASQGMLAEGLSENIVADLSRLRNLFVIAAESAARYRRRPVDVRRAGRELGVRFVLDGTLQREGDRVRVTVHLVDAADGHHVWGNHYDRTLGDLFGVQEDIGRQIVTELEVTLTEGEIARVMRQRSGSAESYEAQITARALMQRLRKDANRQARAILEHVLSGDPDNPYALALLAYTHSLDARYGWSASREDALQRATTLARQALEMDEDVPHAYGALAHVLRTQGRWEEALAMRQRGLECAPNAVDGNAHMAGLLVSMGRPAEALGYYRIAMRLQPHFPPWYLVGYGRAQWLLGHHAEAEAAFSHALQQGLEGVHGALGTLVVLLVETGRMEEARAHAAAILDGDPAFSVRRFVEWQQYRDPAANERILHALRQAGLPD